MPQRRHNFAIKTPAAVAVPKATTPSTRTIKVLGIRKFSAVMVAPIASVYPLATFACQTARSSKTLTSRCATSSDRSPPRTRF